MSTRYEKLNLDVLRTKAKERKIVGYSSLRKADLINLLRARDNKRRSPCKKVTSPCNNATKKKKVTSPCRKTTGKACRKELESMTVEQLRQEAKKNRNIGYRKMKKVDLINEIVSGKVRPSITFNPITELVVYNPYDKFSVAELRAKAQKKGVSGYSKMNKSELGRVLSL